MSKPSFDPTQPFESLDSKPAFDPTKPFESVDNQGSQPWYQTATDVINAPGNYLSSKFPVASEAISQASQLAPWNQANQALKSAGGSIAQAGGYLGGKIAAGDPRHGIPGFPTAGNVVQGAGVGLGEAVAVAPEALAAGSALKGLYNPENSIGVGLRNNPTDISPQYTEQNQAVGIKSGALRQTGSVSKYPAPELQGLSTKSPRPLTPAEPLPSTVPETYPSNPGGLVKEVTDRVEKFGDQLSPQVLNDYKQLLDQNIGDQTKIPKIFQDGGKNPLYAQASDARAKVNTLLNKVVNTRLNTPDVMPEGQYGPPNTPVNRLSANTIKTRQDLINAYLIASKRTNVLPTLIRYGETAGKIGGAVGGIGAGVYELIKGLYKKSSGQNP